MRWGEDDGDIIGFGKRIRRRTQSQNLDAFVFVLVGNVDVSAEDAQHLFLHAWRCDDLPELVYVIGEEAIEPAAADFLDVLVADDHRGQL